MTAIVGFAGPDYGLLAVDRNIVGRLSDGSQRILTSDGGKLHAGPGGWFAGAGKARLLAAVAKRVAESTDPAAVARAMRVERKARYAKARAGRRAQKPEPARPEETFGVLLRRPPSHEPRPEVWVLTPDEGYRPSKVAAGRPLVTGPEAEEIKPLIGVFRLLFSPTPGPDSLTRNVDLLHLYFWLRNRLNPVISAEFDLAVMTPESSFMETRENELVRNPQRAEQMAAWLQDLGLSFRKLAKTIRKEMP